ncbi:hypothetical protein MHBO_003270, partial [Bonamia ostreae]
NIFKNVARKPPLTVCWSCHDKCIYKRLVKSKQKTYIGLRNFYMVNKLNDKVCLFPPKKLASKDNKMANCVICDKSKVSKNCQICGELVCNQCIREIPLLPEEFRLKTDEKRSNICNECSFKLCSDKYHLGTWYNSSLSLKKKILMDNNSSNVILKSDDLNKMQIQNFAKKTARFVAKNPFPKIDNGKCQICQNLSNFSSCSICSRYICDLCYGFYYLASPFSLETFSPLLCKDGSTKEHSISLKLVCFQCREIAFVIRNLFYPIIIGIGNNAKSVFVDNLKKKIIKIKTENLTKNSTEKCSFCKKLNKEKNVFQFCEICRTSNCPSHLDKVKLTDKNEKMSIFSICVECRYLIISKKFSFENENGETFSKEFSIEKTNSETINTDKRKIENADDNTKNIDKKSPKK